MTENAKTLTFLGVGLAAIVLAFLTRPSSADLDVKSQVGEVLAKKFQSPDQAKRLRIVRVNEDTATRNTFEVAEKNGLWSIPSKNDYPADATKQMAQASSGLIDRKILEVASDNAGDHVQFGVVDPLGQVEAGQKGVGTRVTISDAQDQPLVDLIVGKEVKDAPGKHYVCVAGQPVVYVVEVDPTHLSTKFEDWIEKDLLKLSAFDLQQVDIKDYSAELVLVPVGGTLRPQIAWDPRGEFTLGYADSKWNPIQLKAYDKDKKDYAEFRLSDDEELNTTSLDAFKTAVDDLKIVDVVRKPQGLSQDLKAGEDFLNNRAAQEDLVKRGFTPTGAAAGGPQEIISSDGEVIATLKNGTEYVLRFGNLVQVDEDAASKDPAAKADAGKGGVHRYLFAMARFNESAVKKPELQELPALPTGGEFKTIGEGAAASGHTPATATTGESKQGDKQPDPPPQVTEDAAPQEKEAAKQDAGEKSTAATADTKDASAAQKNQTETDPALAKLIADRKRIEADNERKLDEYQSTLEKGKENVKNLNLRFGDWYFVVDNDVFTKIRLGRDAVIRKKEKKAEAADAKRADESILGLPGMSIPGLPGLPAGNDKGK